MTTTGNERRGSTPVYRQVESELRRRIRGGELAPEQRLPTETALAAEWGVNRLTIRQAIGELARAGYVTVRQGSGTYVTRPPVVVESTLPLMPSTDADTPRATEHAQANQTETLVGLVDDDTDAVAAEALDVSGSLLRVDTLVRNNGQPFLVGSYWLEADRFPGFTGHISDRVAPVQLLEDRHRLRLRHSWRTMTATVAGREDAFLLEVPPGSPVMLREGVNVDPDRVPTMFVRRRIRGDRIRFTMHYDTG